MAEELSLTTEGDDTDPVLRITHSFYKVPFFARVYVFHCHCQNTVIVLRIVVFEGMQDLSAVKLPNVIVVSRPDPVVRDKVLRHTMLDLTLTIFIFGGLINFRAFGDNFKTNSKKEGFTVCFNLTANLF